MDAWRRHALATGALAVALAIAGRAIGAGMASDAFEVAQPAPGVFVHHGAQALADRANHGDIANIGFIVGSRCVAVIDTGGSPLVGRRLKAAITRSTDKPVCYIINTHMHPDHVLGNKAFEDTNAVFVAHSKMPQALAARASAYLGNAVEELGQQPDSSWVVLPDRTVDQTMRLDLGDRKLVLRAWPTAHTNNDLTVFDAKTGTLWLGDLLFVDRVPSLDGSILGWRSVLGKIRARKDIERVVPGHGPVPNDWRAAINEELGYLETIEQGVRRALNNGRTLEYAIGHVAKDERGHWLLFDDYNTRNVTQAYTELEWQ